MCWGGLEWLITCVNLVIYTSKVKVLAKLHKESEMWVLKWSVDWKSKGKIVLQYFLDIPILFIKIFSIFTRWFKIVFSAHEKLIDRIKSWHLHSSAMSQNFREISSDVLELLPFFSLNDPTDKNAFGQFGWFSSVGHILWNVTENFPSPVGYCLLTYFWDEITTVTSWIWVDFIEYFLKFGFMAYIS